MNQGKKATCSRRWVVLFLLALLPAGGGLAQNHQKIAGRWEGAIELPGAKLDILVEFKTGDTLRASIDIPAQGAKGLPLSGIVIQGEKINFDLPNVPGTPHFDGLLAPDGNAISGTFSQAGQSFKFHLTRRALADIQERALALRAKVTKINSFIDSSLALWKVPALSIAIIKDDSVVMQRGFGYRDLENKMPADENTLYAIGSTTKAFTAFAIALLVDDGKVDWDEPVRTYLPEFKMQDKFASERMTPRDLVTHRSGLPRHDLMWYGSPLSRQELFQRLQYLEPSKDFRTTFQYQNLMYMTAGYLVGQVSGGTWEDFVRARILQPLEMTRTNFSVTNLQADANHALPYQEKDEKLVKMDYRNIDAIGPAGSLNSSVAEMSAWVRVHLNKGKYKGTQLISESALNDLHTPYMTVAGNAEYDELTYSSYGLGWFIQTYRGHPSVSHGGNIDGFSAHVSLLPDDNVGMVILTNKNGTPLPSITARYAADLLLDMTPIDWNSRVKAKLDQAKATAKKKEANEEILRIKETRPSHPLAVYAGEYAHRAYGVFTIELADKGLGARYTSFTGALKHWHYDVFQWQNELFGNPKLTFFSNERGDIDRLEVVLEAAVKPIVFMRKASARTTDPQYLAGFAGEYVLDVATATFSVRGDKLYLAVTGQPEYTLEPYTDTEFKLKGLSGYSVKFETDQNGKITGAIFIQPNGIFKATRK